MNQRPSAMFLICATGLASCSVNRVTFEEGTPDAAAPPRCELGVCIDYGTGADGAVTLTTAKNLNTDNLGASTDANGAFADGIAFQVVAPPFGRSIVVAGDPTGAFIAGDQLLLIDLQGASGDLGSVGKYEVLEVGSASSNEITVTRTIVSSYAGTDFANQKVLVQRIPQLASLDQLSGGLLTASPWDGLSGARTGEPVATGIVALFVKGTLSLAGSGIDVSNKGFRGGVAGTRTAEDASGSSLPASGQGGGPGALGAVGGKGGGVAGGGRGGLSFFAGGAAGRGGGGGGSSNDDNGCGKGGSGGGGAAPSSSGENPSSLVESTLTLGGGAAAGGGGGAGGIVANLAPVFAESGGHPNGLGGTIGQPFAAGGNGSAGGAGGGLIFVFAGTLTGSAALTSNGGAGGSGGGGGGGIGYDGAAGGGGGAGANGAAGGSIFVRYGASSWVGTASTSGGPGGGGGGGGAGDGGGAGGGGGGGSGGGGGGGGTRTFCSAPLRNASDGGAGGAAGSCGAVPPNGDSNIGGGGAASGGGGSSFRGNCTSAAANSGGLSAGGNGTNGSPAIDRGNGGAGGDTLQPVWGAGGGGGQAGSLGATGFTSLGAL